jgi:hypothetical protein
LLFRLLAEGEILEELVWELSSIEKRAIYAIVELVECVRVEESSITIDDFVHVSVRVVLTVGIETSSMVDG